MNYTWDFGAVWRDSDMLLSGALGTLQLAGSALAIAVPLGLLLAVLRMLRWPVISWLAVAFIDFFRTSALLVLIFWFFYAFPILVKLNLDAYEAATLAIGLQASTTFAELFRGGIQSISQGQWEAARALGMGYGKSLRWIILPQALRRMLPVFFTTVIELTKSTALAAGIAFEELAYNASRIASDTFRPIETYLTIGGIYFCTFFLASQLVRRVERRLQVSDR